MRKPRLRGDTASPKVWHLIESRFKPLILKAVLWDYTLYVEGYWVQIIQAQNIMNKKHFQSSQWAPDNFLRPFCGITCLSYSNPISSVLTYPHFINKETCTESLHSQPKGTQWSGEVGIWTQMSRVCLPAHYTVLVIQVMVTSFP